MSRRGENIYKRKDGRWEGRYIKERALDGSIHYGYLYDSKYSNLKERLITMKALYKENYKQIIPHYKGTLREWSNYWFKEIYIKIKPSTYASYKAKMMNHILPYLGEQRFNTLSEKVIQEWIEMLKEKLAVSSVRVVFQVLNTCLKAAEVKGLLSYNPCLRIMVPKRVGSKIHALSKEEQNLLKSEAEKHSKGLPVILALETGLRIGEISGLKWEDIDFENCLLRVRRTVQRIPNMGRDGKKTCLIEGLPKSSSSIRVIPLSKKIMSIFLKEKKSGQGSYVFGGEKASEPRLITNWFKAICLKSGIAPTRFHALRHSFATRCIENGVTITTISSLLGHASVKMTLDIYTNSFLTEKRKAIQLIS